MKCTKCNAEIKLDGPLGDPSFQAFEVHISGTYWAVCSGPHPHTQNDAFPHRHKVCPVVDNFDLVGQQYEANGGIVTVVGLKSPTTVLVSSGYSSSPTTTLFAADVRRWIKSSPVNVRFIVTVKVDDYEYVVKARNAEEAKGKVTVEVRE